MKTIQAKTLFIVLLLSTAASSLPAEAEEAQVNLWIASKAGNVTGVKKALESGININIPTENGFTALTLAAEYGHLKVVEL